MFLALKWFSILCVRSIKAQNAIFVAHFKYSLASLDVDSGYWLYAIDSNVDFYLKFEISSLAVGL
jgi:hypothetical protein